MSVTGVTIVATSTLRCLLQVLLLWLQARCAVYYRCYYCCYKHACCLLQVLLCGYKHAYCLLQVLLSWLQVRLLPVTGVTIRATSTRRYPLKVLISWLQVRGDIRYRCYYSGYKFVALSVTGVTIVATSSWRCLLQVLLSWLQVRGAVCYRCYYRGYKYAALSRSRRCTCGNIAMMTDAFVGNPSVDCNLACAGNPIQSCGGKRHLDIWTTGK